MTQFFYRVYSEVHRRNFSIRLAFSFLGGLLLGGVIHAQCNPYLLSMMSRTAHSSASIVGLVCVLFLPFLFSVFLVTVGLAFILPAVAFGKAFCFAFVALGVLDCYGAGGWLALFFLMFSDLLSLPVLWLYWLRQGKADGSYDGYGLYFLCLMLIGSLDFCIVSPFWARI